MSDDTRFYVMTAFITATCIMFLLWHGFHEAGLEETAGYAYLFTVVWFILTLLHTSIAFRVGRKLDNWLGWGVDTDAN